MARQTNILSFDKAKRDMSASRSSVLAPERPIKSLADFPASEFSSRPTSVVRSAPIRGAHARSTTASRRTNSPYAARSIETPARISSVNSPRDARVTAYPVSRRPLIDEESSVDEPSASPEEKRPSKFEAFKRTRSKERAERAFTKQFGGADKASDASEAGSRAAVYKGEMGAKHRQAARMQNGATRAASAKRGLSLGLLEKFKTSPKFIAGAAVAACLAFSCVFLYPAAQQYYQAVRENDRLTAEYAAIEDRNAVLETDVATLQTDAGVETRAHEQLGWVLDGWETANVRGLDLEDTQDESSFRANIVPGSIQAPETWYSPVLDALFGVE